MFQTTNQITITAGVFTPTSGTPISLWFMVLKERELAALATGVLSG